MTQSPAQRVNSLMAAFGFGGRCDDLGDADQKYAGDKGKWTAACDGATLNGLDAGYKRHLKAALAAGLDEKAALKHAYNATVSESPWFGPQDVDHDWVPLPA